MNRNAVPVRSGPIRTLATMMIKRSLLLSAPIVKHFQAKKTKSSFWPKFDSFGG